MKNVDLKLYLREFFCEDDDVDYSTESEVSVLVSSKSNGHFTKNTVTPDRSIIPDSIHCVTVKVEKEEGKLIAV